MVGKAIKKAGKLFTDDMTSYVLSSLIYLLLNVLSFGAMMGILTIAFLLISLTPLGESYGVYILGVGIFICLLMYVFLFSGFKGAFVNDLNLIIERKKPSFFGFVRYGIRESPRFFVVSLIKLILHGLILIPLAALYYFVFMPFPSIAMYGLIGLILVALFFNYIVQFLFSFSYVTAVVDRVNSFSALAICLNFLKRRNIMAFLIYTVYAIVAMSTFIPLINIITYPTFYPLMYSAMIIFFKEN
ncbi:hypothetical protein KAW38_00100 [Candidatus Micrarchaeota archaeon]|nr:hypothetical protein [Candidatus Micrarchaeota archaeon]